MSNGSFGHNIAFNRWWRRRTPVDATPRTPADATPRTPTDAAPRTPADADRRQAGRRAQRRRCHARVKLAARRRWSWARGCKVLTEGCRAFRFQTTGSSRNGQGQGITVLSWPSISNYSVLVTLLAIGNHKATYSCKENGTKKEIGSVLMYLSQTSRWNKHQDSRPVKNKSCDVSCKVILNIELILGKCMKLYKWLFEFHIWILKQF